MSRKITVKSFFPWTSTCEMEASIGNSSPFDRSPTIAPNCLIPRWVTWVCPKVWIWILWASWNRSGMNRSRGCPMVSVAREPNICSAAALNNTIRCSSSTEIMASMADAKIPRSWASPAARLDSGFSVGSSAIWNYLASICKNLIRKSACPFLKKDRWLF